MMQLGIYPDYQYSGDPKINPKINPNVKYPPGMDQLTIQPVGPYMNGGLSGPGSGGIQLLGGHGIVNFLGPKRSPQLLGFRGFGSIQDSVSSIGTFVILGLAAFGGWNVYKRLTK